VIAQPRFGRRAVNGPRRVGGHDEADAARARVLHLCDEMREALAPWLRHEARRSRSSMSTRTGVGGGLGGLDPGSFAGDPARPPNCVITVSTPRGSRRRSPARSRPEPKSAKIQGCSCGMGALQRAPLFCRCLPALTLVQLIAISRSSPHRPWQVDAGRPLNPALRRLGRDGEQVLDSMDSSASAESHQGADRVARVRGARWAVYNLNLIDTPDT